MPSEIYSKLSEILDDLLPGDLPERVLNASLKEMKISPEEISDEHFSEIISGPLLRVLVSFLPKSLSKDIINKLLNELSPSEVSVELGFQREAIRCLEAEYIKYSSLGSPTYQELEDLVQEIKKAHNQKELVPEEIKKAGQLLDDLSEELQERLAAQEKAIEELKANLQIIRSGGPAIRNIKDRIEIVETLNRQGYLAIEHIEEIRRYMSDLTIEITAIAKPKKEKRIILIVEDEAPALKLLTFKLEREGYEIIAARDGVKGLEKAVSSHPDLILMDLSLPLMNGYELIYTLRADPQTEETPIIVVTEADGIESLKLDVQGYISKPLEIEEIVSKVRAVLDSN